MLLRKMSKLYVGVVLSSALFSFSAGAAAGVPVGSSGEVAFMTGGQLDVQKVQEAAEKGSAEARYLLGEMYKRGEGVTKSEVDARHWYRLAAYEGHPGAQRELGLLFLFGWDTHPNYEEGFHLLTSAAEKGDLEAQVTLGNLYLQKEMGRWDVEKALHWLKVAAERGDMLSMYALCGLYGDTTEVLEAPKDPEVARKWCRRVLEKGKESKDPMEQKMLKDVQDLMVKYGL